MSRPPLPSNSTRSLSSQSIIAPSTRPTLGFVPPRYFLQAFLFLVWLKNTTQFPVSSPKNLLRTSVERTFFLGCMIEFETVGLRVLVKSDLSACWLVACINLVIEYRARRDSSVICTCLTAITWAALSHINHRLNVGSFMVIVYVIACASRALSYLYFEFAQTPIHLELGALGRDRSFVMMDLLGELQTIPLLNTICL